MSFLLDTCILSKLRKLAKYPDKNLEAWFQKHPETSYFVSVLSIGEIQKGISKITSKNRNMNQHKMILEEWLYGDIIPGFQDRILPLDMQVALSWGKMIGELQQKGVVLSTLDSLIAATAITNNLIVVTENLKDFAQTGAIVFSPWHT